MAPSGASTSTARGKKPCECGRTPVHYRKNHSACAFNPKNAGPDPLLVSPVHTTGRSSTSSGPRTPVTGQLQAGEWEYLEEADEYDLEWQADVVEHLVAERWHDHVSEQRDKVIRGLQAEKPFIPVDQAVTPLDLFMLLGGGVINKLLANMTRKANLNPQLGVKAPQPWEVYVWLALTLYADLSHHSLDVTLHHLRGDLKRDRGFDSALQYSVARHMGLTKLVCAADPVSAGHAGSSWGPVGDSVAEMREFVSAAFQDTIKYCLTRNLFLVLDDELIACRSRMLAFLRHLSHRKRGRDGFKADVLASSLDRQVFSVRYMERFGYNQLRASAEVVNSVDRPRSMGDERNFVLVAADQGYSREALWGHMLSVGAGYVMVTRAGGMGHAFPLNSSVYEKQQQKKKKKKQQGAQANHSQDTDVAIESGNDTSAATVAATGTAGATDAAEPAEVVDLTDQGGTGDLDPLKDKDCSDEDDLELPAADGGDDDDDENGATAVELEVTTTHSPVVEPAPDENQLPHTGDSELPPSVVDDSPLLGRQLRVARRKVKLDDGTVRVQVCLTYRDYNKKTNAQSTVVRIALSGTGVANEAEYFGKTLCMVPARIPSHVRPHAEVLFYPAIRRKPKPPSLLAVEAFLKERCAPLTCWQRCADWFCLRLFTVSGTTGGQLAKRDWDARQLLVQNPELGWDELDNSETHVAGLLRAGWVFNRGLSTQAMKIGTGNEDSVIRAVRGLPWCSAVFECGLFAHKDEGYITASPDGVAVLKVKPGAPGRPPELYAVGDLELDGDSGGDGGVFSVHASLEAKTRVADATLTAARAVRSEFGRHFSCRVGDDVWWRAVPPANRAQVLQQATVLGVDYVLFVTASTRTLVYCCLVHVPAVARETYKEALAKWDHLMEWAHSSLGDSKPPAVPNAFNDLDRTILASHLRMWRALRRRRERYGVEKPVYIIKCAAQVLYNILKGGLDGSTQYVQKLTAQAKKEIPTNLEQKLVIRTLKQLVVNAFVLSRTIKALRAQGDDNRSFYAFRRQCENLRTPIYSFAEQLAVGLLERAGEIAQTPAQADQAPQAAPSPSYAPISQAEADATRSGLARKRKRLLEQANEPNGSLKRLRLNKHKSLPHTAVRIGNVVVKSGKLAGRTTNKQLQCVVCRRDTSYKCGTCGVPLHALTGSGAHGNARSCWHKWHNNQRID